MKKKESKRQQYSLSLLAAISQKKVMATEIIEGGVDAVIFENFIYQTLRSIRSDEKTKHKEVVLLMDNATTHKHQSVMETAMKMKVNVLFNAEYSPWLDPIERLFGVMKKEIKKNDSNSDTK